MQNTVASEICRCCLSQENIENCHFIHNTYSFEDVSLKLSELLELCASVKISKDNLPQYICNVCFEKANESYKFKRKCEYADKLLKERQSIHIKYKNQPNDNHNVINPQNNCDYQELQLTVPDKNDNTNHDKVNSIYECFCKEKIQNESEWNNHLKSHTKLICKLCNKEFYKLVAFQRHIDLHKNKLREGSIRKQHFGMSDKQRTCDKCSKVFKTRSNMLRHRKKHDSSLKTCPYCDEKPQTPSMLSRHKEEAHSDLKSVICSECGKAFFQEANLRLHMVIHTGVKKFICEVCGVSFTAAGNLNTHKRLHSGIRPYACKICPKTFTQQSALRSHEATHSRIKQHHCPKCNASFSRIGAMRNHQKRHSPTRPFICTVCGMGFKFSSERKRHMSIHTGEKTHICTVCGKEFNRKTNLIVHQKIHSGEMLHTSIHKKDTEIK